MRSERYNYGGCGVLGVKREVVQRHDKPNTNITTYTGSLPHHVLSLDLGNTYIAHDFLIILFTHAKLK
jgi:hypothetical protein